MSIEIGEVSSVNPYYLTAVDAVTTLAEIAMQQQDPNERLRLLAGVGQMATGVLAFVDTASIQPTGLRSVAAPVELGLPDVPASTVLEIPAEVPAEEQPGPFARLEEGAQPAQSTEEANDEPLVAAAPDPAPAKSPATKREVTPKELTEDQRAVAERYPELKLSEREAKLMRSIIATNGEKFSAADLSEVLGNLAPQLRRSTMGALLGKVRTSSYSGLLVQKGQTRARRYWWKDGEQPTAAGRNDMEEFHPTPALMPHHQPVHEVRPVVFSEDKTVVIERAEPKKVDVSEKLAEFALALGDEGHKYLSHKGVPVNLNEAEVGILLEVLQHGGTAQYADLLKGTTLQELKSRGGNPAALLNAMLAKITSVLAEHELPWSSEKTVIDHKKVTLLHFGILAQKVEGESLDFLDTRLFGSHSLQPKA